MNDPSPNPKSSLPISLPDLGTGGAPVRVSAWFVEIGDLIETGEPVLEVVMAGITCDVCSPASGRISRVEKSLDAHVVPGDIVAWVEVSSPVTP